MRQAPVLERIKTGEKIPKPPIRVRTTIPEGWNPSDINGFAKAYEAWRRR